MDVQDIGLRAAGVPNLRMISSQLLKEYGMNLHPPLSQCEADENYVAPFITKQTCKPPLLATHRRKGVSGTDMPPLAVSVTPWQ